MSFTRQILSVVLVLSLAGFVFGYNNQPIADATNNNELNTLGFTIQRGGSNVMVPQGYGWCSVNSNCSVASGPNYPGCYSAFYSKPNGVNFTHCGDEFNYYNMTYEARLYLLDLEINGWGPLTSNGQDPVCTPLFSELCYNVMWIHNIRAGFGCPQSNSVSFKNSTFLPPCSVTCYDFLNGACSTFAPGVLRGAETISQFCELMPTGNCYSAAVNVSPALVLFVLSLLATFSLSLL